MVGAEFNFANPKLSAMLEGERSIHEEIARSLRDPTDMTDDMALELKQEADKTARAIHNLERLALERCGVEAA